MSYTIRPEEHELREARGVVQGALETCKAVEQKQADFQVSLGWLSAPEEELGASVGQAFVDELFLQFNSIKEEWKEELEEAAVYGYGQSLFLEKVDWDSIDFYWQELLLEAFSLLFVEKALPDSAEKLETGEEPDWEEYREHMGDELEDMYVPWNLAYQVGKQLMERHELEEMPGFKRSDVIAAGDRTFSS